MPKHVYPLFVSLCFEGRIVFYSLSSCPINSPFELLCSVTVTSISALLVETTACFLLSKSACISFGLSLYIASTYILSVVVNGCCRRKTFDGNGLACSRNNCCTTRKGESR